MHHFWDHRIKRFAPMRSFRAIRTYRVVALAGEFEEFQSSALCKWAYVFLLDIDEYITKFKVLLNIRRNAMSLLPWRVVRHHRQTREHRSANQMQHTVGFKHSQQKPSTSIACPSCLWTDVVRLLQLYMCISFYASISAMTVESPRSNHFI